MISPSPSLRSATRYRLTHRLGATTFFGEPTCATHSCRQSDPRLTASLGLGIRRFVQAVDFQQKLGSSAKCVLMELVRGARIRKRPGLTPWCLLVSSRLLSFVPNSLQVTRLLPSPLPCQGRPVTIRVAARRFRCLNRICSRRRTGRLTDLQRHLVLALGGGRMVTQSSRCCDRRPRSRWRFCGWHSSMRTGACPGG